MPHTEETSKTTCYSCRYASVVLLASSFSAYTNVLDELTSLAPTAIFGKIAKRPNQEDNNAVGRTFSSCLEKS